MSYFPAIANSLSELLMECLWWWRLQPPVDCIIVCWVRRRLGKCRRYGDIGMEMISADDNKLSVDYIWCLLFSCFDIYRLAGCHIRGQVWVTPAQFQCNSTSLWNITGRKVNINPPPPPHTHRERGWGERGGGGAGIWYNLSKDLNFTSSKWVSEWVSESVGPFPWFSHCHIPLEESGKCKMVAIRNSLHQ